MASIQELRRIALELERSKNVGNLDDDTTTIATENLDEFGNPLVFDGDLNANQNTNKKRATGAPLLSYDALVALYQSDIDLTETEIHTIVTSLKNSNASISVTSASSSPSELLSAWLKLINTHQTIANEATRMVKENGVMDPELIATFVSSQATYVKVGQQEQQQQQVEDALGGTSPAEADEIGGDQEGSQHNNGDKAHSDSPFAGENKVKVNSTVLPEEELDTNNANENKNEDSGDDDFDIDGGQGGAETQKKKKRISFINNGPKTANNDDEGANNEKTNNKGAQSTSSTSTSATATASSPLPRRPLPTLSLTAKLSNSEEIPTLLTDAYNSLNIVYERAIRSMANDTVLFLHEMTSAVAMNSNNDDDTASTASSAQKERTKSIHATAGTTTTTVSPATLLSLLLFRSKDGVGSPKINEKDEGGETAAAQQPPVTTMMSSLKLWRMYIGARTSQALFLRLNLKRVIYPLFDRALMHGNYSATSDAQPAVSVGPAGLRLWLDYCDLCMLLADFTKLRVVLQQAFEHMPSAAIHTRLWQYVRHRIFCLTGSASSTSSAKKKSKNPSEGGDGVEAVPDGMTLLTTKMINDSVILSAISKYNESLYSHFLADVTEAIGKAVSIAEIEAASDDNEAIDNVIDTNNTNDEKAFLLRGIKLAAAKYTSSVTSTSTSSSRKHQHHQRRDHPSHPLALPLRYACSAATPQPILALFWKEYIRAFPTQRTLNEYLSFLSMSVHTAVANYHTLVSKLQELQRRALQAAKRRERSAGHANNVVDKEEAVVVALSDELTYAKSRVALAVNNYMNFLMEKAFNKHTPTANKGAAMGVGAMETAATSTTSNISISVNFETWETISFVLQNLNIVTSSSSSSSEAAVETLNNTSAMLNRADVRRWIEAVIGGLERAEFESNKSINRLASSGIVHSFSPASSSLTTSASLPSSSSVLATISPVHVKAKIDILLSCAVALAHFSLFDEAFELLWEYAIKSKGSFDQIEIFHKLFSFTCRMLQSLATQSVTVLERQQLRQQLQGHGQEAQNEERSLSSLAETAVRRLTMITAEYDRLRLNLSLRIDRRNVNAWIERVAMYRDAFEEKRPVASAAALAAAAATNGLAIGGGQGTCSGTIVDVETMKNVYMTAIQALSSLASSSTATATGSSLDALLFAGGGDQSSSSNRQTVPSSSSFSTEALSAVVDLYDEYANFIYYTIGDYESLRSFLRKSVLSADFGAEEDGAADEDDSSSSSSSSDGSDDDDDGEDKKDEGNNAKKESNSGDFSAAVKGDESSAAANEKEAERKKKLEKIRKMRLKKVREEEKRRAREFKQHQKEQRMIKGAKGIRVNIRLFGMLLDITLAHAGPAAARDLLLSWVNNECPLSAHRQPSGAAASSTTGGNRKRPASLSSSSLPSSSSAAAAVGATEEENKKRERDYYRHLSNRGVNTRLKQRRAELLSSHSASGEGGASALGLLGSVGGGSGGGGLRDSPIATKLWLSEEMWDLCLHFASLIDRQNELIESKNYSTTKAATAAAPKVWAKCVIVGMASPWLSMRVVTRLLSAAGATNLPIHIIGKTSAAKKPNDANSNKDDTDNATAAAATADDDDVESTESSVSSAATILAKASESIPNSLFFTSPDWSSLSALIKKFSSTPAATENGSDGTTNANLVDAANLGTPTSTSFELFRVDPSLPLSIIRKQLTATRDALAALSSALSVSTDPIAIATLALWRINLQSEEARLLELVFSKLKRLVEKKRENNGGNVRDAKTPKAQSSTNKGEDDDNDDTLLQSFFDQQDGATNNNNTDGAASVLLVRESLRNTVTSSLTAIILVGCAEGGGSTFNPDSPAATTLSAATSQLLLRYIWFESQQVPSTSAAANAGHGHDVENFVAYGTQYMPVLICPKTFLCALVKNSEIASSAAGTSPTIPLGLAGKILCDTDRYRVLDLLMKTLVATRGIDLTLRILQKAIASTTSPADVAFLSSRLAACLVMRKDVLAARSVFDKLAPTQAKAILAMYANMGFEATTQNTLSGGQNNNNDGSNSGGPIAPPQSHLNLPPPPHSTIQEQMKSFWATWLSFENAFGTPSTMGNVRQWYGKIMKHLGPLVVHRAV